MLCVYEQFLQPLCDKIIILQVKEQIILSATEASEMILRVDEIIKCAPRQRGEE